MWLNFIFAFIITVCILFIPGTILLSSMRLSWVDSLCFSPVVTSAIFSILSLVFGVLGIDANPTSLIGPILLLALAATLIKRLICSIDDSNEDARSRIATLIIYLVFGLIATVLFFVKNLDGADSTFQAFDDSLHYAKIRSFLNTLNFSSYNTLYDRFDPNPFISDNSFYPSAWHGIVALLVQISDVSIPLAINVVNAATVAFIFTSGIYLYIEKVFGNDRDVHLAAAALSVCIASCPWDFLTFGPLYPNLLSLAFVPSSAVAFMRFIDNLVDNNRSLAAKNLLLFFICCLSVALAQPNGIFTLAVLLAPFIVGRVYSYTRCTVGFSIGKSVTASIVASCLILLIWTLFFAAPPLQGVVQFNWESTYSKVQAGIDLLLFGMLSKPVQPALSILLIMGIHHLIKSSDDRWIIFPFLFSAVAYVACVSSEGFLKHFLAGFWYTDPHRIAALVGLFSVPILVIGLSRCLILVRNRIMTHYSFRPSVCNEINLIGVVFAFILICFPNFQINGVASIETAFGRFTSDVASQNNVNGHKVLSKEELEFSKKALALVPEDAVVINSPNDGSGFLYALQNAKVLYREFALPPIENEKRESEIIRHGLNKVATDQSVKDAVDSFNAKYLLVLDLGCDGDEDSEYFWSYWPDQWDGIDAVNDETPGFTTLLSEGDMRLYRID